MKPVRLCGSNAAVVRMFDTDKFISCIQEKPALWDKSAKEYCDKNAREKAWIEVGEIFYEDWAELDANEREEKGKDMKNKWRNIRDNFLKCLNRGKSGDPAAKTRKYVYADSLQFLLNTVTKRRTSGNIEAVENPETEAPLGDRMDEEEEQPPSTSFDIELPPPPQPASRQRQSRLTSFQSAILEKLDWASTDHDNEDPDRIYILSLLSDYKKLNDDEKMDFKFVTLEFFRNAQRRRRLPLTQPSTQSSMYMDFLQSGPRLPNFPYQLQSSSFPIQVPYPTPSSTLMQPPSPMHQSSLSPSRFPMQRPCPTPTPSPNSTRSHPVPSPSPSSMQSQPTLETTQQSFYNESSESSTSMDSHYHY